MSRRGSADGGSACHDRKWTFLWRCILISFNIVLWCRFSLSGKNTIVVMICHTLQPRSFGLVVCVECLHSTRTWVFSRFFSVFFVFSRWNSSRCGIKCDTKKDGLTSEGFFSRKFHCWDEMCLQKLENQGCVFRLKQDPASFSFTFEFSTPLLPKHLHPKSLELQRLAPPFSCHKL